MPLRNLSEYFFESKDLILKIYILILGVPLYLPKNNHMKKFYTGILFILIVLTSHSVIAQKFKWNEAKRVKHGLYQYPIGEDGGVSYRLGGNQPLFGFDGAEVRKIGHFYILKYSNGSETPEAIKVKTDYDLYKIEACYISDKKIIVLYKTFKGGYSVDFYADVFDENGKREKTVALIDKKTNRDKKMLDRNMYITVSENNNCFLVRFGEIFKMFDKDLDKKWERNFEKSAKEINVTNTGTMVMISYEKDNDKSYSLVTVDAKNKLIETKMGAVGDIFYDQENDLVYALTFSGAADKGHFLHYGTHTDLTISKSFSYAVYQGADMKKLDEQKNIAFDDKIITEAKDKDDVDGLVGLELKSVTLSNAGTPVFIFNTRANTFSGELALPECILLVKIVNKDETVQKLITKISKDQKLRFIIPFYNVIYNNNDICLLYYTTEDDKQGGSTMLNIRTYNLDLELGGTTEVNPYKEHGYGINILHFYKQSDHSYLFFGLATNTKMGMASLSF